MLPYPAVVSIITLTIYTVYLARAIYLTIRLGFYNNSAWLWLAILALCRLTQVSLDLAATEMYRMTPASNTSLESGVAILTEVGLTSLFMATTSLLNATSGPKGRWMQWILLLLNVPLVISLVLIVAGSIDLESRAGLTFAATEPTKAGVALYCACFVILILTTVVMSLLFFLVDVVYMMCFAFESLFGSQRFNVISGSGTLQLCMQVIMEFVIVGLYLGLGLGLPNKAVLKSQATQTEIDHLAENCLGKLHEKALDQLHSMDSAEIGGDRMSKPQGKRPEDRNLTSRRP
ncbi:hypothetical protein BCR34DRAFT_602642 [Clohesyomyces aquaticus]|uniref:DUF7702 domain-containing protein n=1 Tax=Clohesyomyces aquaticus TaxID=1231657 RepID=A0A1Y1ZHY7_9PLEO|nr:hypothetical protein BCR34DRAFT_602642 [Clohesyomyces aquaticus]